MKSIICLSLLILISVSCSKNDSVLIDAANEKVAGCYQYISLTWNGQAIDLNGDGVLNSDIIKEYEGSVNSETAIKSGKSGIVFPLSNVDRKQVILIDIPIQGLLFFRPAGKFKWMAGRNYGTRTSMSTDYFCESSGKIRFGCTDSFPPSVLAGNGYEEVDRLSNFRIIDISDEILTFKVDYTLYDFATKGTVTAPIYAVMRRTTKRVRD